MSEPSERTEEQEEECRNRYGPFAGLLLTEPGYLALLFPRPERPESRAAVVRVRSACKAAVAGRFALALFEDDNWKAHLIAATAVAVTGADESMLEALWTRIEHGSPVVPQLAVAAYFEVPSFEAKARSLVERTEEGPTREVLRFVLGERAYDEAATGHLVASKRWKWEDVRTEEAVGHAAWWLDAMNTLLKR